jgi:hypothetical protein
VRKEKQRLKSVAGETWHLTAEKMIEGVRVTSREVTQAVFENYNAKPPRKHLPSFKATHSNSQQ